MSSKLPVKPVFIGLMGSGKSAIARRLVARLDDNIRLIDVDKHIVAKVGLSIPEIFEKYGEAEFRKMETEMLKEVIDEDAIISTGGGVVLSAENRAILKANPPVIWFKGTPEFLVQYAGGDPNRPLVAQGDALNTMRKMAKVRNPLYEECADAIMDRDELGRMATVDAVIEFLEKWPKA